jgi:hypothetical protein
LFAAGSFTLGAFRTRLFFPHMAIASKFLFYARMFVDSRVRPVGIGWGLASVHTFYFAKDIIFLGDKQKKEKEMNKQ